jgi:hypothetical protein
MGSTRAHHCTRVSQDFEKKKVKIGMLMYKAILADLTVIDKIWEWRKIHFMKDGSIMLFAFLPQTPSFPASSFWHAQRENLNVNHATPTCFIHHSN